jgi:hypothetical protein
MEAGLRTCTHYEEKTSSLASGSWERTAIPESSDENHGMKKKSLKNPTVSTYPANTSAVLSEEGRRRSKSWRFQVHVHPIAQKSNFWSSMPYNFTSSGEFYGADKKTVAHLTTNIFYENSCVLSRPRYNEVVLRQSISKNLLYFARMKKLHSLALASIISISSNYASGASYTVYSSTSDSSTHIWTSM